MIAWIDRNRAAATVLLAAGYGALLLAQRSVSEPRAVLLSGVWVAFCVWVGVALSRHRGLL